MRKIIGFLTIIVVLTLTVSVNASWYDSVDNDTLRDVPHCLYGEMTLTDSGWLVASNGHRVDYHAIMANPKIHGVPDSIYYTLRDGQSIAVCQNAHQLRYFIK